MKLKRKLKKPTGRQVSRFALNAFFVVIGNAITAGGAALFIVPNGFVMGGTTGIGIFVRNLLPETFAWREWIVNITVYAANIALFILGAFLLGKRFALSTLAGTFLYPGFMSLYNIASEAYIKRYGAPIGMVGNGTDAIFGGNLILTAVLGALMFGFGIGVVIRVGSSTGGTDIPALILHKFFGFSVSVVLWITDILIILLQFIARVNINFILYGMLISLISNIVIGHVSPIGVRQTQVKIVSRKYEEIRDMILNKVSRGATVLYGETGYLKEECRMVLTVISHRQLPVLKAEVQKIDPEAFMTVSVVSEVRGRGFSSEGVDFLIPEDKNVPTAFHSAKKPDKETKK